MELWTVKPIALFNDSDYLYKKGISDDAYETVFETTYHDIMDLLYLFLYIYRQEGLE